MSAAKRPARLRPWLRYNEGGYDVALVIYPGEDPKRPLVYIYVRRRDGSTFRTYDHVPVKYIRQRDVRLVHKLLTTNEPTKIREAVHLVAEIGKLNMSDLAEADLDAACIRVAGRMKVNELSMLTLTGLMVAPAVTP